MTPTIGFVLVTWDQPEQTLSLCRRLSTMFGAPPIAIHHDFSQCALDTRQFPRNVHFVEQWNPTERGTMSMVDAKLATLALLYREADPDWFVPLGSSDYPIRTPEEIREALACSDVDGYFDLQLVGSCGEMPPGDSPDELAFGHPQFVQHAYARYVAIPILTPAWAKRLHLGRESWTLRSELLVKRFTPFGGSVHCYAGDPWFLGNRRIAKIFLERTPLWERLHDHFANRVAPEGGFFSTLVGSTPGVQLCPDTLRYTDRRGGYGQARFLGREDFPKLLNSGKFFAGPFPSDGQLLGRLEHAVCARAGWRDLRCA